MPDTAMSVRSLLSPQVLELHAGWLIFDRGVDYAERGAVSQLQVTDEQATAVVDGTAPYDVAIRRVHGRLQFSCSCPMGEEDEFCKHLVAVGLQALDSEPTRGRSAGSDDAIGVEDVAAWLDRQPAEQLRQLLREEAARDPELSRRLALRVAAEVDVVPDLAAYERHLAEVFGAGAHRFGMVTWDEVPAWRRDVHAALDGIEDLVDTGFAEAGRDLAERALTDLDHSTGWVDDSGGFLEELLERAQQLHLRACELVHPDPGELAATLLHWELSFEFAEFLDGVSAYAEVLGPDGLATYRRLAEQVWQDVPARQPGDRLDLDTLAIRRVMERLATATGDPDELVDVLRHGLASAHGYARIVRACLDHDDPDRALQWAAEGWQVFGDDHRLLALVEEAHAHAGDHEAALATARDRFDRWPALATHRDLQVRAEALARWPQERDEALDRLHEATRRRVEQHDGPVPWGADGSVLVQILLAEDEPDRAWAAHQEFGCDPRLQRRLADARARTHPDQALAVYRRLLDDALEPTGNRAYDAVVELLQAMRPVHVRLDRRADFDELVTDIRTRYRRRRNLLARLDRAGLAG